MQDKSFKNVIFGKAHQVFKAKVAMASSSKLESQIKTFKVRLDADIKPIAEALQDVYTTISGTEESSLYRYILSLKALGFSFRPSGDLVKTESALAGEKNRQFLQAFTDAINDDSLPSTFSLIGVYKTLITPRRKQGGIYPEYDLNALTSHFMPRFGGNMRNGLENHFGQFVVHFCDKLLNAHPGWEALNSAIEKHEVLPVFDAVATEQSIAIPFKLSLQQVDDFPVKNSTIFYNPDYGLPDNSFNLKKGEKDYLLHTATALAMFDGMETVLTKSSEAAKAAKDNLTTTNANALSWLLSKGLAYFKSSDAKQIATDYGCPETVAEAIKSLVQNIPLNHALGQGYSGFRTSLQGQIDSWVSNYYNRLYAIHEVLSEDGIESIELPEFLGDARAEYFFNFMPLGFDDLKTQLESAVAKSASIKQSLSVLAGIEMAPKGFDVVNAIKDLDNYQEELEALMGMLNQLHNRIKQEIEIAEKTNRKDDLTFAKQCHFHLKSFDFDKILQRKVERIDFVSDIDQKSRDMLELIHHSHQALSQILAQTEAFTTPVTMRIKRELAHIERLKAEGLTPEVMAKRHVWSYVLKNVRNLSDETKKRAAEWLKELKLFTPPKHREDKKKPHSTLNKFMFNNEGDIYQSLFSRRRNKPYDINLKLDPYEDSLKLLSYLEKEALKSIGDAMRNQAKEVYLRDWVMIQRIRFNLEMDRLPESVPSKLIFDTGITNTEGFPVQYRLALEAAEVVGGDLARKCLNHYISLISRAMSFVFRESFAIKMGFTIDSDIGMLWKAKDKPWTLPKTASSNPVLMALSKDGQTIDTKALKAGLPDFVYRNFPHELYIPTPFATGQRMDEDNIYLFAEKQGSLVKKKKKDNVARVVAKSSFKKYFLDAMLRDDAELSRPSFLFEGRVKQVVSIETDVGGKVTAIKAHLSEPEWVAYLAQPIKFHPSCLSDGESLPIFDRLVAIDLGEVGIGYAVMDVKTGDVLAQGNKRLPSLAKLPSMVRKGRKSRQPRQGYKQVFSTKLIEAREHAVGELKFYIDNLMNEYLAFPIFESSVPNLQSGSREIETVYKNLMQYYTFSSVSAHKVERKSNWLSADKWEHPYLLVQEKVEKKGKFVVKMDKAGNPVYKPLNLFPGATVNPAGTSQTCSCCGVNAIDEIRNHFANSEEKTVFVNGNGEFTLSSGVTLKVEKRFAFDDLPEEEVKDLHRRNRRSPWGKKYRAGNYNEAELLKMTREHLRRPHDNLRSKDTSQSQFHCVNIDCGKHLHADMNAAINIGKKWLATTNVNAG